MASGEIKFKIEGDTVEVMKAWSEIKAIVIDVEGMKAHNSMDRADRGNEQFTLFDFRKQSARIREIVAENFDPVIEKRRIEEIEKNGSE